MWATALTLRSARSAWLCGDDPETPRFVETVVGRGYRFAAPVICSNGDRTRRCSYSNGQLTRNWTSGGALGIFQQRRGTRTIPPPNPPELPPRSAISVSLTRWRFVLPLVAAGAALTLGASLWFQRAEYFWRSPIADARFQAVTDFEGAAEGAALSRDGQFVAFLSNRDGQMDVWVTQVGSGQLHNLTRGSAPGSPIHRSAPWVLARWLVGHVLVSQARRIERWGYQRPGSADAGRTAEAIP